jgi:uncharacterized protein
MVRVLYVILICVFWTGVSCAQDTAIGSTSPLSIVTQDGRNLGFQVEVVDTPYDRARGLMFRKELPDKHGMLFVFEEEAMRSFWMRNTYVPLDIIFINAQREIVNIGEGVPLSEAHVPSIAPAKFVLELEKGTAERLDIKAGDKVHHPAISRF